jgi:hypothetical protein
MYLRGKGSPKFAASQLYFSRCSSWIQGKGFYLNRVGYVIRISRWKMTSHLTGTNKVLVSTETAGLRMPNISPAAVWSFLKDTRGDVTWPIEQMAKTLNISVAAAKRVLALLRLQGYVQTSEDNSEWMTTAAGEEVSGSKMPRYSTERVENALIAMSELCKSFNQDKKSAFIIKNAIAFGDFLGDRSKVQAPDVGIELAPKTPRQSPTIRDELDFLKHLKHKSRLIAIRRYEPWMRQRSHRDIL